MEKHEKENDNILAFDTLFTTNSIQILKILLPCIPSKMQHYLAVYIKYLELQYTLSYLKIHPVTLGDRQSEQREGELSFLKQIKTLYPQIQNYLAPSERQKIDALFSQMEEINSALDMARQMQEMMQFMNTFSEETQAPDDTTPQEDFDPISLLKNMLSPEQQSMFGLFYSASDAGQTT